ncbi:hypothetical protein [Methanocella conradii]|uniref:hypothetical protein n=1 Tax=Methanocella conradii TaxID=1175444 RepID=UPI00157E1946|nr:hypothetical protein [Methanocella conradii]
MAGMSSGGRVDISRTRLALSFFVVMALLLPIAPVSIGDAPGGLPFLIPASPLISSFLTIRRMPAL